LVESYFSRLRRMATGSITTCRPSTCTSTQITPLGWKSTVTGQTTPAPSPPLAARSIIRLAACGPD